MKEIKAGKSQAGDWPQTVLGLQEALTAWGFGEIVGECDGVLGSKTERALKQFQAAMGLSADGVAGRQTWEKLREEIIRPRLTEEDMACQCPGYCDGHPNPSTAGIRLLIERIWREAEKKYPGMKMYVSNRSHPAAGGATAGGQRCAQWNRERGGARQSRHLSGDAADIFGKLDGVPDAVLRQHIEELALRMNVSGGVGSGARSIVHVDIRGKKARWTY